MYGSRKTIDVDRLREDMENDALGAAFVGGYGGAFMEASDIRRASDDEVIRIAEKKGIDLDRY